MHCRPQAHVLSLTINWKIWAHCCHQLLRIINHRIFVQVWGWLWSVGQGWVLLFLITSVCPQTAVHTSPLSSCQMIGMPNAHQQQKIQNIYSWTTIYRKYRHVTSSSSGMEFHAIFLDEDFIVWKSYFTWFCFWSALRTCCSDVCSAQVCLELLVTLNQCQWSQKCLNIFPSRTMLQFTGYVLLISTQWHHKIFSLISKTTIFIIHWTPVICEP